MVAAADDASKEVSPLAHMSSTRQNVVVNVAKLRLDLLARHGSKKAPEGLTCDAFVGVWADSYGNSVLVQPMGVAGEQILEVRLSKPSMPDKLLSLWQAPDKSGWHCGDAVLDSGASSTKTLKWVFRTGRVSLWYWRAFTLDALARRGLDIPAQGFPSDCSYPAMPTWSSTGFPMETQFVPALVPVLTYPAPIDAAIDADQLLSCVEVGC